MRDAPGQAERRLLQSAAGRGKRMEEMIRQVHGGDRYRNQIKLDFSVNTNPLGMPDEVRRMMCEAARRHPERHFGRYPDPDCVSLRQALARFHEVAEGTVLCGNGASELIYAIVNAADRAGKGREADGGAALNAVVPVPSFGEYERALRAAGARIRYHRLPEAQAFAVTEALADDLSADTDLLVLCNPGNPAGNRIPDSVLERILDLCGEYEITVLLDECFLELTVSDSPEKKQGQDGERQGDAKGGRSVSGGRIRELTRRYPRLIVLKAFTKLYAMPGLRLGYCVCGSRELSGRIKAQLPCWNVSGIAQLAGMTALDSGENTDYIGQSRALITAERAFLVRELQRLGMSVLPGCANFVCFYNGRCPQDDLYGKLLEKGILIRDCESFRGMRKGWYRAAVRPHRENEIFIDALAELTGNRADFRKGEDAGWAGIL